MGKTKAKYPFPYSNHLLFEDNIEEKEYWNKVEQWYKEEYPIEYEKEIKTRKSTEVFKDKKADNYDLPF